MNWPKDCDSRSWNSSHASSKYSTKTNRDPSVLMRVSCGQDEWNKFFVILELNCVLGFKCREYANYSNFNETIQFSKAFLKARAWKPGAIFTWYARRAVRHVITKKRARLNFGHISNSRFVLMRWNSICCDSGETISKNAFSRRKKYHLEPKSRHK